MPVAVFVSKVPLNVVVPVPAFCVIDAAVMALAVTFAALTIVKAPIRGAPIVPDNTIFPVPAVRFKFCAPPTDPESVMSPAPAPVFKLTGVVRVTAPLKLILALFVVMLVPNWTGPIPD